jgi:plastocyanin
MNKTINRAAAVITLALVTVGCGSDSDSGEEGTNGTKAPPSGQTFTITAAEFAFDPSEIEAPADSEFTIEVVNAGVIEHDFAIEGHDSEKIVVPVGETVSGSFSLSAGTYEFFCTVAGHKESGMKGTLTVG